MNRCCESVEMGAGKSSVSDTLNSNGHCGDCIARSRASVRITRSVLGCDCDACSDAINSRCDSVNLGRTHCRYRAGCFGRSAPGNLFHGNLFVFATAVFVLGLLCAAFRMEKTAYRYASITLAIIVLIPRSNAAWIVALHRFFEVSVGILVALALVAVWPEQQPESTEKGAE
jgi:fusaric acid resistance family protein